MRRTLIPCYAVLVALTGSLWAAPFTPPVEARVPKNQNLPADGLDRRLFEPDATAPARPAGPAERPPTPTARELGPAAVSAAQQPLVGVAQNMQMVAERLRQADTGRQTQDLQQQIVADLESLLRQARAQSQTAPQAEDEPALPTARRPVEQPKASSSGAGKPADKPAVAGGQRNESQPKGPPDRRAQLQAVRDALKQLWGELPDRAREQMLQQVPIEEFLPQYETLIEAYFRRLAEEQGRGP